MTDVGFRHKRPIIRPVARVIDVGGWSIGAARRDLQGGSPPERLARCSIQTTSALKSGSETGASASSKFPLVIGPPLSVRTINDVLSDVQISDVGGT